MSKSPAFVLIVLISLVALAGSPAAGAATPRSCAPVTYKGASYPVKVLTGSVGCVKARKVVLGFMRSGESPMHWSCFRGHGKSSVAATCGNLPGYGATTVIRAMKPR
jgi:hypothetical protein